jgi:hypothetical protein
MYFIYFIYYRRVLEYQADLDAQVAKEMAWREDDQEYIRRRDALFARNLQVKCLEFIGAMPVICRYNSRNCAFCIATFNARKTVQIHIRIYYPVRNSYFFAYRNFNFFSS